MSSLYVTEPPTRGKVLLSTTRGDIEIELWPREAPKAVRNFVQLCLEGYYIDTVFHRVVPDFIVQGGDPTQTGTGGQSVYDEPFADEFHSRLKYNRRGLVGMSNNGKDDNGSQFFFTLAAAPELQGRNTLFGRVAGETIYNVLKIGKSETDSAERPLYPARILSSEVIVNPFDDIVPRTTHEELLRKRAELTKVAESKTKKRKLLSYDDEEVLTIKPKAKVSSSFDVQKVVPEVKSVPVSAPVLDEPEEEIKPKEDVAAQIEALKASLKRKPAEPAAPPPKSYIEQQRLKYKSKAIIGKKKKLSEADVLNALSKFTQKLKSTTDEDDVTVEQCTLHNIPNCQSCNIEQPDTDVGNSWLGHKLVFPDALSSMSEKERREMEQARDGGLEVIDPRLKAGQLRLQERAARVNPNTV